MTRYQSVTRYHTLEEAVTGELGLTKVMQACPVCAGEGTTPCKPCEPGTRKTCRNCSGDKLVFSHYEKRQEP